MFMVASKGAMRHLRGAEVSTVGADLGGKGRTLDLLEALEGRFPAARMRLVVGTDIIAERHRWHRWDQIESLAPPIIIGRQGHSPDSRFIALPEVSSTKVRARLAAGESVDGLVPREVIAYIAERGLYRKMGR